MYIFGYSQSDIVLFSGASRPLGYTMNLGTLLIFASLFSSIDYHSNLRTRAGQFFVTALLVWHIFMALINDPGDLLGLPNYFDPYCYTLYLYPLLLLIPVSPLVRSFFTVSRWTMLVAVPLLIMPLIYYTSFGAIQFIFEGFAMGAALLLMTNQYHSRRWIMIAVGVLLFAFLVATVTARRNLMMTTMLYLLGGAYMVFFRSKNVSHSTQIFAVLSGVVILLAGIAVFMLNSTGIFAKIAGRAGDNTRDYVFLFFFWDMLNTPLDMVIGRGIRGQYECQGIDSEVMRGSVENGYLQLMLKGGIIYILLYVGAFVTAIRQAWRSTNQLCRAAIIILCVQLFDMLPFGLHAVNLKTFMIWMCVSVCLNPTLCAMSDDEMLDELTEKKQKLPQWNDQ